MKGSDSIFSGPTGKSFRVLCPPNCETGITIGTMIYLDESNICKSAIHAGFLDFKAGGFIYL